MACPTDLLEQAEHLALRDKRRPKQANLRRAVSTAYYALFHLLIEASSANVVSGSGMTTSLRPLVGRAYVHGEMRDACTAFASGRPLPEKMREYIRLPFSPDLRAVADSCAKLQQLRHTADYNTGVQFTRSEVVSHIEKAKNTFDAWQRIENTTEARNFLLALLLWRQWK